MAVTDPASAIRARSRESTPTESDAERAPSPRRALIAPEPAPPPVPEAPPVHHNEHPRVKMRQRLARLGTGRAQTPALDPLFRVVRANHPKADLHLIERAYKTAEGYHQGTLRKSGDAYITHPLAVTTILAELGMNETTLCAALLHDTVEDTAYTLDELSRDFGEEVALLVDGCTKVEKVRYGESAKSETIRKMIVAMSQDIRVLVIKLADRLHNMRTLHYLRPDKQSRIATETLEIYAPLAHRLGMNAIKWELEDLAFGTLHPKVYDEIVRLVAEAAPSRDEYLSRIIEQVQADLRAAKIKAEVTGRPKHYYSIYQKMIVRGRDFSDIYDLVGLRVTVESNRDCYAALGVLHVRWNPLPGRFKDYIAMPKFNMYQSLHTTVLGPEGKPVELQIRTDEMHRRAEYGVAAHWKYKEGKSVAVAVRGADANGDLDLGAPAAGLAEGDLGPGGVPGLAAVRDHLRRGVRVHPEGRGGVPAAGLDPGRLRVRDPHRGGQPDDRRQGQRPAGAAGVGAGERRRGGDLHLEGAGRRTEPRLAVVREEPAGPEQDQALLQPRAPRGVDRERQGHPRPADAQGRPAAAAAADPAAPDRGGRVLQAVRRVRAVRGGGGEAGRRPGGRQPADHRRGRRGHGRRRDQRGPGRHRPAAPDRVGVAGPSRGSW